MYARFRWLITASLMVMIQACGFSSSDVEVKRITPEQAKVIIDGRKALLVDVRTEAEHTDRNIPGTDALIPVQELSRRIQELEPWKGKPILLYCRSGNRTQQAAKMLQQHGFTDVTDLKGGIQAWLSMGYPTATGPFVHPKAP
ncbi:MAG: rhodanese-like domain-containing protein [Holophaga sp.]|nr:rhodanese-like domain-containing protein [Holophaga sp.]